MKVLVVTQHFWPENFRINDLVLGLQEKGHEVTVLTGVPNYPVGDVFPEFQNNPKVFKNYHGIDVYRVPVVPRKKGKAINLILNFLSFAITGLLFGPWKLRCKKFDKIFVFGNSPLTVAIPAILLSKIKRAPICIWVMDLWPETLVSLGVIKKGWQNRIAEKFMSFLYNNCSIVLGQSKSFINSIKPLTKRQVSYFASWSDVSDIKDSFEYNFGETFNIVFAGNMGEAQDFPSILKAAEILKKQNIKAKFLIVGDGRVTEWVTSEIISRGLQDHIALLGRHPVEKMGSLFKQADALFVSLKSDPVFAKTIPGKVQSYLAAGKPILSMMDGEVMRVVQESGAGFAVQAGDYKRLAQNIIELSSFDMQQLKGMGDAASMYYENEFQRDLQLNKLVSFIESS